ncbi:transporter [Flavobacterium faecale]|uniref:Transporter n=1 Tax=Flavobacterium faecale TaxID=1355330 RepID=A0A2S1LES9_9FLAO|nr:TolC family protein [Flavobacterium faecale]AWG22171.1 transporter [Flavobacterium faecale]
MKKSVLLLIVMSPIWVFSQQKITLTSCYELAAKNYPLAKQTALLQQKSTFEIDAMNKAKLPKIDLNAQATYQSAVTQLPISIPNITITPLNKDQYRATVDVNQLIYNGGMIEANSKLKTAQTLTQQQQVAVNLYTLKSRINYSYLMILLWQDQNLLLLDKKNTIVSKIKEVKSAVKNGAVLPASEQVLEAELLKLKQALTENSFQRTKELQNLASLTKTTFEVNTVLEKPRTIDSNGTRPEIQFFDLQQAQIDASKEVISKSNLPKLNAFGQAGYGNPGLNMLNNSFEGFYIVGLKMNWTIFDWDKSKTDKQALDIAKEIVSTDKETFETNNQMQLAELQTEIEKMLIIIQTDDEIIQLREKVVQSSDSQLRNGVITASDYVTELNHLFEAKTNQKVHETQLELAQINYQTTKGIN